jgi:snRNA-activating protein complex subunit 3
MESHRAVTLERAIESLMPSVPSVAEDAGRSRNHRGTGAKNHQLTFQEEAQKAEKARLMTKHLSEQTAMAPLASKREVELEHKQLEAKDYKRALLRKEVDVTKVMWKARELFDCEVGDAHAERARARGGGARSRMEDDAAAAATGNEAMIWIELYHPVKQGYLLMDVIVRGSTPLAAFKDMIYCLRDVQAAREGHPPSKNGFLFIEGVFYNDMRTPGAIDYSEHLIEFQKRNALMAPGAPVKMNNEGKGFTARDMDGVKFSDVPLTIGRPYVMTHQGKCEHKWRVRDVRAPHSDDETRNEMYPLVIREGRVYRRGCSVCGVFDSSHVTYGDKLAAESPSFFCKLCFDAVHCDENGKLMYNDFEDYQYDHE